MPVFILDNSAQMPSADLAEVDGLLAIGGDLSSERLLNAYQMGIFPWYNEGEEILWWSPDPRSVLFPDELKISKSMKQVLRKKAFEVRFNTCFEKVIRACKESKRKEQEGTWITEKMLTAYIRLHDLGYAHSVEVYHEDELVGGLYGILLGKVFFGESMFSRMSNASKYGFIEWVGLLKEKEVKLIDCQIESEHLNSLGARNISRKDFLSLLRQNIS